MKINSVSNPQHQQNFGMAIYADHKAINKLTKFIQTEEKHLFRLNELITSQKNKPQDIFLSTDQFDKLTARVGYDTNTLETNNPIDVVEYAARIVDGIENRMVLKSQISLNDTIRQNGKEAATQHVINKLKIDA